MNGDRTSSRDQRQSGARPPNACRSLPSLIVPWLRLPVLLPFFSPPGTACPFVPAICFPVPIVGYLLGDLICQYRRQSHMGALLQRENERLAAEGLRWRETVHFHMQAQFIFVWDLQWIPEARPQWEIAHPDRRAISREPYPARLFFSVEETRQVDHMSLVVQHQLRAHKLRAQERLTRTPSPSPPPRPLSPQESHPDGGAASGAFEQPAPAHQSMDAAAVHSMPRPRPQQCGACGAVRLIGTPQVAFYCHHCGTPFPSG